MEPIAKTLGSVIEYFVISMLQTYIRWFPLYAKPKVPAKYKIMHAKSNPIKDLEKVMQSFMLSVIKLKHMNMKCVITDKV